MRPSVELKRSGSGPITIYIDAIKSYSQLYEDSPRKYCHIDIGGEHPIKLDIGYEDLKKLIHEAQYADIVNKAIVT